MLWQHDTGKLEEEHSYHNISNVLVRQYGGTKYLSYSEAPSIVEIPDISDVIFEED